MLPIYLLFFTGIFALETNIATDRYAFNAPVPTRSINLETDKLFQCFVSADTTNPDLGSTIITFVIPEFQSKNFSDSFIAIPRFKDITDGDFFTYLYYFEQSLQFNILPFISGVPLKIKDRFISQYTGIDNTSYIQLHRDRIILDTKNEGVTVLNSENNKLITITIGESIFKVKFRSETSYEVFAPFSIRRGDIIIVRDVHCEEIKTNHLMKGDVVVGEYSTVISGIRIIDTTNTYDTRTLDMVDTFSGFVRQLQRLRTTDIDVSTV